jgi:hypothetical protein
MSAFKSNGAAQVSGTSGMSVRPEPIRLFVVANSAAEPGLKSVKLNGKGETLGKGWLEGKY